MKTGIKCGITITIFLVFLAVSSWAYPTFMAGEYNHIFFKNAENWVDVDSDNQISTGDYFYGILDIQEIVVNGQTIWQKSSGDYFTGYFLTEVINTTYLTNVNNTDIYTITLGTYTGSDPNGIITDQELAAGVVMKLFTDTSTAYQTTSDIATDIQYATDGNFWASLTIENGYWYTTAPLTPPGAGNDVGDGFGGLNFYENTMLDPSLWVKIDDPVENVINIPAHLIFQVELTDQPIELQGSGWRFGSNDPATVFPTPEPASIILMGSSLMLIAAAARKKFVKK